MGNFMSKLRGINDRKEDSTDLVPLEKKVNVVVCSGSLSSNVEGLVQHIRRHMNEDVEAVRFEPLPYNIRNMKKFDLSGIDVLLLCHSIENRRFSITDVTDALYDDFLPRAKNYIGRSKIGVIAHDFPEDDLSPERLASRMQSFCYTQSTTFQSASLVLIGGQLSNDPVQLTEGQLKELQQFLGHASSPTPEETVALKLYRITPISLGVVLGMQHATELPWLLHDSISNLLDTTREKHVVQ